MNKTVTKRLFAVPEPCTSQQQNVLKLTEILATYILEFASFEQIPHPFLRIELRGIGRQAFQVNACRRPSRQKVFYRLTAMNGGPIPDDEQFSRDLAQELLEKAHHILSLVGAILRVHEQSSLWCQRCNSRDMIARQWDAQHRRLSPRRIGAHRKGQQVKTRLIYKNDSSLFLLGFFLRAGQRSSHQAVMACSFLWVATSTGFCWLCLMARRRRLQWAG